MSFAQRASLDQEGGVELVVREKDAEIAELRARLDDKERMISALRSSARKRDIADLTADTPLSSPSDRRSNSSNNSLPLGASAARVTGIVSSPRASTASPTKPRTVNLVGADSGLIDLKLVAQNAERTSRESARSRESTRISVDKSSKQKKEAKRKSVDEMTRLLDEMITERVHNGERIDSGYSVNGVNGVNGISNSMNGEKSPVVANSMTKTMRELRRTSVRISEPLPTAS